MVVPDLEPFLRLYASVDQSTRAEIFSMLFRCRSERC
jgi:hypothetical protein